MKCVGMQYLEAIRKLKASGFHPLRSVYLSFVPDEEIGGHDGVEKFVDSDVFTNMNLGIILDEGVFYLVFINYQLFQSRTNCSICFDKYSSLGANLIMWLHRPMNNMVDLNVLRKFPIKSGSFIQLRNLSYNT